LEIYITCYKEYQARYKLTFTCGISCGISNPSCVKFMIYSGADAVIVGSAIIKKIKDFVKRKNIARIKIFP
jgi:tryptophan synthase alpha subunit